MEETRKELEMLLGLRDDLDQKIARLLDLECAGGSLVMSDDCEWFMDDYSCHYMDGYYYSSPVMKVCESEHYTTVYLDYQQGIDPVPHVFSNHLRLRELPKDWE